MLNGELPLPEPESCIERRELIRNARNNYGCITDLHKHLHPIELVLCCRAVVNCKQRDLFEKFCVFWLSFPKKCKHGLKIDLELQRQASNGHFIR